jgi:hypothetical protein
MNENSLRNCISRQNQKVNVPLVGNYVEFMAICFLLTVIIHLYVLLASQFHWIGTRFDSYREPSYPIDVLLGFTQWRWLLDHFLCYYKRQQETFLWTRFFLLVHTPSAYMKKVTLLLKFHNSNLYCLYGFPIRVVDGMHLSFADHQSVLLVVSRVKAYFIKYHKHFFILYFMRCPRFYKSHKRQHYNNFWR